MSYAQKKKTIKQVVNLILDMSVDHNSYKVIKEKQQTKFDNKTHAKVTFYSSDLFLTLTKHNINKKK